MTKKKEDEVCVECGAESQIGICSPLCANKYFKKSVCEECGRVAKKRKTLWTRMYGSKGHLTQWAEVCAPCHREITKRWKNMGIAVESKTKPSSATCKDCGGEKEYAEYHRCDSCAIQKMEKDRDSIKTGRNRLPLTDPLDKPIEKKGKTTVYARDVLQPKNPDGSPNQDFIDRYGDGLLKGGSSQLDGMGKKKEVPQIEYREVSKE